MTADIDKESIIISPASDTVVKIYNASNREYKVSFPSSNFNDSHDIVQHDKNFIKTSDCVACLYPESYYNCPQSMDIECQHATHCILGTCNCTILPRMTTFLNSATIKRHRRQQIETPSSDFGLQKAKLATKKRIKDSMRPFDNETEMRFKPIPATELFEEFINMLKGNFKRDMLEYIVRESRTLPIIDIDFQKENRTYSKTELENFTKSIGFNPEDFNLDELLSQCHNFILNEPIISCTEPILERDLPNKPMEIIESQQDIDQDYVRNVDLEKEVNRPAASVNNNSISNITIESPEALCARYAALEANEIERCEIILRTAPDTLAASFCCNDSGSNIQLTSIQNLERMGGNRKNIIKKINQVQNSSGQNTLVIGEIEIELYAVQDTSLIFLGKHNFVVIDNPQFKEILLGMSCLNHMRQELKRKPVTKGIFYGLTCPKGHSGTYHYTSNCPNYRAIGASKDKIFKAGKPGMMSLSLPLSIAEYVFCSDEINHTSIWHNKIKIHPDHSHKTLSFKDIVLVHKLKVKPHESFTIKKGEDFPNSIGFPNHFDCGCRNNQDDIYLESSCFYTEHEGNIYKGHGVIEESLANVDFKIGINIDEIGEQPTVDGDVLGHLDSHTQSILRAINTKHKKAFNSPDDPIGLFNGKKFDVEFVPGTSFYQPPIHLKGDRGLALDKEIVKLLKAGVIEKAPGAGDCNIPAFVVGKSKGRALLAQTLGKQTKTYDSYRLVLDMRMANSKIIGHGGVLLPSQDDLLTRMQCAKFVAVADVSSAFHALEYTEETAKRMRFSHRGTHYIFKRAIMGALPSSQMLEQAMGMMFNQYDWELFLKDKNCNEITQLRDLLLIYCDDLIIGAPTIEQFYMIYEFMLQQIAKFNMKLELKKLKIMQPCTTILGYDFSRETNGTMTHCIKQAKIDQFLGLPTPKSKRMLSSYLSSSAIYFRNIIGVKLIMSPLYLFLRSESNTFEFCHFRALCMLRLMMSLNLKQACMDGSKILTILSDSSMMATHGMVAQFEEKEGNIDLKPIMCSSKLFDKAGIKQPSIYKEMMGVINIVKQAEHLIRANTAGTFIVSDCRPLALALRARSTTIGLAESAIYLSSLPRLKILHLRGSEIRTCDVYSRLFSFGLASKEKFNKDQAMTFKSEFFGNLTYTVADLEKVIQKHEDANYLKVSPIKPGKLTTSDFYAKILEQDNETQYFRGLFKGFQYIDKFHSFWRPGIKNENRDHITEAEFKLYVGSGTFKEFRDQLNSQNITDDKVFYTISQDGLVKQGVPSLFISQGYQFKCKKINNEIELQITLPCPPACHLKPVLGPQIFLQSNFGELSTKSTEGFTLCTSLTEYSDSHGYYDTMYKCDTEHSSDKIWTLRVGNCQSTPLCVKTITHYAIPADLGARIISHRISRTLCNNLIDIDTQHLAHRDHWDPEMCQLSRTMIDCFNGQVSQNSELTKKGAPHVTDHEHEKQANKQLNTTAIMSLLMIAQASHFGAQHFTSFLLEMQEECSPISDIIKQIKDNNLDSGKEFHHKRYTFSLDKAGLLWASLPNKNACRLVAPSWFVSVLIKNLHSGPVHLSSRGMSTLISRTFLVINDSLSPARLNKDPFNLPTDNKTQITKLCTEAAKQCIKCLLARPSTIHGMRGAMRHLETNKPGSVMSFDLLEGLPRTPGTNYTTILVGMDRASGYSTALPQKSTSQAETFRNFMTIFSIVGSGLIGIETDGSQTFTKVSEFCCSRGIIHKRYGPRSETLGLAERGVRLVRQLLSTAVYDIDISKRRLWDTILPDINHSLNNTIVKPELQPYSRRELFWNPFSNSAEVSNIHINNIYQALDKLKTHREEVISKLAKLNTIPSVRIGDMVLLKRRKTEIPVQNKTRAFIPPTGAQLYRVVGLSPLFCRVNSILDNSFRTVARNKITHLDVNEWIEVSNTIPGLLRTIYQAHKFIPGFSKRPSFDKLKKDGHLNGEHVDQHIKDCVGDCSLLKDVPTGLIYEEDLGDDWDTQIGTPESIPMERETEDLEHPDISDSDEPQLPVAEDEDDIDQAGERQAQLPVLTDDDEDELRRVTRSMTRDNRTSFHQCLLHQASPQSAVLTFSYLSRLMSSQQEQSILRKTNKQKKHRLNKKISFAEQCLVTQFQDVPGTSWVSSLHRMADD